MGLVPVSGFNKLVTLPLSRAPSLGLQVKVQGKRVSEKGRSRRMQNFRYTQEVTRQKRAASVLVCRINLDPGLSEVSSAINAIDINIKDVKNIHSMSYNYQKFSREFFAFINDYNEYH